MLSALRLLSTDRRLAGTSDPQRIGRHRIHSAWRPRHLTSSSPPWLFPSVILLVGPTVEIDVYRLSLPGQCEQPARRSRAGGDKSIAAHATVLSAMLSWKLACQLVLPGLGVSSIDISYIISKTSVRPARLPPPTLSGQTIAVFLGVKSRTNRRAVPSPRPSRGSPRRPAGRFSLTGSARQSIVTPPQTGRQSRLRGCRLAINGQSD